MLTEYEQERAERIAQNQLRLKELGLHEVRRPRSIFDNFGNFPALLQSWTLQWTRGCLGA